MIRCRRLEREDRQLTVWLTRRRRSTIDWNVEDSREEIDYWRIDRVLTLHHDWLTDIQNRKINYWLSFSQTHDHSRWFTMRQVKERYIHRLQRKNFSINADSRSFSLTHDTSSESEMQSSLSKKRLSFRKDSFCCFTHEDSFCCFVISLKRTFVSWRFFLLLHSWRRHASWSFSRELHTLTILFYLLAYLDEQFTCRSRTFDRMSISLAELRARDLLCKRQWIIVIAIDRKISCWRWNRHELNCAEDDIVANWSILFLSTRWSFRNECEIYIVRHDENQI